MMVKRTKLIAAVLAAATLIQGAPVYAETDLSSHKLINRYSLYKTETEAEETFPYYIVYLQQERPDATTDAAVDLTTGVNQDGEALALDEDGYLWDDEQEQSVTFRFRVEEDGYYNIEAAYTSVPGGTDAPRRKLQIDGKTQFIEMQNIQFDRLWCDDGLPQKNVLGDEVRPKQKELFERRTIRLQDYLGRYNEPLKFYLTKGEHTLTLSYICEPVRLHSLRLVKPEPVKSYAEYQKEYEQLGYQNATKKIHIDAERPSVKSSVSMRLETSTDPEAEPTAIDHVVFNAIGGTNWREGNTFLTWDFHVEEKGLYALDLRAMQKYNDGLSSYRQIMIDGKVPFEEFLCYEFKQADWDTIRPPYLLALDEGDHTLTMSVKTSPYLSVLLELETTLEILSAVIQNVIMITGISPDVNFDYELDEKIPDLMEMLQSISDSLDAQIGILSGMSNMKTSTVSGLEQIRYRVDQMLEEPILIPRLLNDLISDQTTLSSWISGFNNLALMLDFIELSPPEQEERNPQANIFEQIWYSIRQFANSFIRDYSAISLNESDSEPLNVWISRGKEWAEALDQIIYDDFTQKEGIPVRLNMLPAGQLGVSGVLLLALTSGTAPDLVLGTDSITPAEYGMRGAIADLSVMPGFDKVRERFLGGALIPYEFEGKTFGLPETMDFTVMYVREDVMNLLGLRIPDTWQELYSTVLPELKRKGMDFWYEGGLYTFLFQEGGSVYTSDGRASALADEAGMRAFKQFTDLYLIYQVPVTANFYNRFRAGQMPIGISSFTTYLQLSSAAPELQGKWQVYPIPGVRREGGEVDRSTGLTLTSVMMLEACKQKDAGWKFIDWYTSAETQQRYANDLLAYIGSSAKWFSANLEAFDALSWDTNLRDVIEEQRDWLRGIPNVVGGYITTRHIENARVRTVINNVNYRQSIEQAAEDITREMENKVKEFQQINEGG